MAATAYTVKKGDTRSGIAKALGVNLSDVGLGASGNPDLIQPGESLTIGKPDAYVSEVKDQLGAGTQAPKTEEPKTTDAFGTDAYKTKATEAGTKKQEAFNALKGIEKTTYDTKYNELGLGEKKSKMSELDTNIASARKTRDDSIAKIKSNPNLSAAQMAGDIKKIADYQNSVINNYIGERNSVASEYNTGLSEVDKAVKTATADLEREYGYWSGEEKSALGQIKDYEKALTESLKEEREQSNFERELAQALEIAGMKASDSGAVKLQLIENPITGKAMYKFNPVTGEITPVTETPTAGGSTPAGTVSTDDARAKAEALAEQLGVSLADLAKTKGYTKGGFLGFGKQGDVDAYLDSLR